MPFLPKDPVELFALVQKQMEELRSFLSELEGGRSGRHGHEPPLDIYETAADIVVEIELPGLQREDIQLRQFRNVLVVEGVKRKEPLPGVTFHRLERHFGRFVRVVEVPLAADPERVRAHYDRGVLLVSFARLSGRQRHSRIIPID
jgi:HSP20 family protein